MGVISFNVKRDTDTTSGINVGVTVSDADIDRVAATAGASYFPSGVLVTAATSTAPAVYRAPTPTEVVQAMVGGVVNGWVANVLSYEKQVAAAHATAAVAPITTSPAP